MKWWVLTKRIVVIKVHYICKSSHYAVYLKLIKNIIIFWGKCLYIFVRTGALTSGQHTKVRQWGWACFSGWDEGVKNIGVFD